MSARDLIEAATAYDPAKDPWLAGTKVCDLRGTPIFVYHGTSAKFRRFNFKNAAQKIIWFTSDRAAVEAREVGAQGSGYIAKMVVKMPRAAGWKEYEDQMLEQLKRDFDGAILPDGERGTFTGFVFKPDQVKIVEWIKL